MFYPKILRTCVSALLFLCIWSFATGQCLRPALAVINSCVSVATTNDPTRRVEVEFIILRTEGVLIDVDDIGIDLPANGFGRVNGDVGTAPDGTPYPCGFTEVGAVNLNGCNESVGLNPGVAQENLPANSYVIFITTAGVTAADIARIDFSAYCNGNLDGQNTLYVLQNACKRTISALANRPGATNLRTVVVHTPCGPDSLTYDTNLISTTDGSYYDATTDSYGERADCGVPLPGSQACESEIPILVYCDGAPPRILPLLDILDTYPRSLSPYAFYDNLADARRDSDRITEVTYATTRFDTIQFRAECPTATQDYFGSILVLREDTTQSSLTCTNLDAAGNSLPEGTIRIETRRPTSLFFDSQGLFTYQSADDPGPPPLPVLADGGAMTLTGLAPGRYVGSVTTVWGCQLASCTFTVGDPPCANDVTLVEVPVLTNETFTTPVTGEILNDTNPTTVVPFPLDTGCDSLVRYTLLIEQLPPDLRGIDVYLPSAFSPNGDGINDAYQIGVGERIEEILSVQIFDRWGGLIYDGLEDWRGRNDVKDAPVGTYVVRVIARTDLGTTKIFSQVLSLIR
ncbi:T9SS type B sorting domain-containing protein [Neolewinella antarctica]|uniref:Gliding motility-associated-like protein n=1 Tax=Neolewinella antarctica TaxID=442734 RepID=A0ABX0X6K2_9BACT|nr:gliding motility-associated C-terminal domain-containing protein [Neolewinella antarctica]NJC24619.1 gliding motility-associated-like protein [Neolewinella antarctica]